MRKGNDKILDNNFNTNNLDFNIFGEFKIDETFKVMNPECYNFLDYNNLTRLQEEILRITQEQNIDMNSYRRLKKENIDSYLKLFYLIYKYIDKRFFSEIEYFVIFCEIFDLDYKSIFNKLLSKYKEELTRQLADKTDFINKTKYFKIF